MEWYGLSVVVPIKTIVPSSTAGKMLSLCALLQRWHSSRSKYVWRENKLLSFLASSIIFLTSATPLETAFNFLKIPLFWFAIMFAKVDFPVPGGPKKIALPRVPASIARLKKEPFFAICSCPTKSSNVFGLILWAKGIRFSSVII